MPRAFSLLQSARLQFKPLLPNVLRSVDQASVISVKSDSHPIDPIIAPLFPNTCHLKPLVIQSEGQGNASSALRVGVVLSGGQAAGGHNVIAGLFDALKTMNKSCVLFGFLGGPAGIIEGKYIEITEDLLKDYRNQGGFDLIGSGRTKIEKQEQLASADRIVKALDLDGLVIIGGDDSNTNAAILAERFAGAGVKTAVVGVPKTIDGDLKGHGIEISFGFDTACKVYSEMIGNLCKDSQSAKKYYFFIKLMGRSASHIALECALQTHPNLTLIGEEIARNQTTLAEIVDQIANLICSRADKGKDYGIILIPEGIIEFIPEIHRLIKELNTLLAPELEHAAKMASMPTRNERIAYTTDKLSADAAQTMSSLPTEIQNQLLLTRDSHGNVQVAKIETERLLIEMVQNVLESRSISGLYKGGFSPQPLFFGYEGRAALPSNFDAQYCYALGTTAALLVKNHANGYICSVTNLTKPVGEWGAGGIPITSLMKLEQRHGKQKPVIEKYLVNLEANPFLQFKNQRDSWALEDDYISPGPIQFFGPDDLVNSTTKTLALQLP